jgi:hypothetical protein
MTKFVHIVYVHPVELGEPNLHKVKREEEFWTRAEAREWTLAFNEGQELVRTDRLEAVYLGCVNDETGELV